MLKEGDRIDLVVKAGDDKPTVAKIGNVEGAIEKIREGQPLPTDAVLLKTMPRCPAHPDRIHAEVVYCPEPQAEPETSEPKTTRGHGGPARVSNSKFRSGWDEVFGAKAKPN